MNVLIYFIIAFIASVTALNDIESKSISLTNILHSRFKRAHPAAFSVARNDDERSAIQNVIEQWNSWYALGRGPGEIFHHVSGRSRARLDLQGTYNAGDNVFERYAVQIDARTFSVVHIQRGVSFGVALIRGAFEESRDHLAHVFLTDENARINVPNDGNSYHHRMIQRRWSGQWNIALVWGVAQAIEHIANKFNRG